MGNTPGHLSHLKGGWALLRLIRLIAVGGNALGTLVVLALVALVNYDVVARRLFHAPFLGAVELVQFSMVLIVFLQLPDVVWVGRLTRSDGFLVLLEKRYPHVSQYLRRLIDGFSAILMGLIALALWPEFIDMWQTKDYFGIPGIFTALWWPIKLTICLSTGLCCLFLLLKALLPSHVTQVIFCPNHKDVHHDAL